jgi:hypothetical protein
MTAFQERRRAIATKLDCAEYELRKIRGDIMRASKGSRAAAYERLQSGVEAAKRASKGRLSVRIELATEGPIIRGSISLPDGPWQYDHQITWFMVEDMTINPFDRAISRVVRILMEKASEYGDTTPSDQHSA